VPRRDIRLRIEDMLEAIQRIEAHSAGFTADQFRQDQKTLDAVVRNLEVIGEAASHLGDEVTSLRPAVPWNDVRAIRHVLVHEYFGVDVGIVWETVVRDLPVLRRELEELLKHLSSNDRPPSD
jgi:uncharacterized protein with HEPN domain